MFYDISENKTNVGYLKNPFYLAYPCLLYLLIDCITNLCQNVNLRVSKPLMEVYLSNCCISCKIWENFSKPGSCHVAPQILINAVTKTIWSFYWKINVQVSQICLYVYLEINQELYFVNNTSQKHLNLCHTTSYCISFCHKLWKQRRRKQLLIVLQRSIH